MIAVQAIQFTGHNVSDVARWIALNVCSVNDNFFHRVSQNADGSILIRLRLMEGELDLKENDWLLLDAEGKLKAAEALTFATQYVMAQQGAV